MGASRMVAAQLAGLCLFVFVGLLCIVSAIALPVNYSLPQYTFGPPFSNPSAIARLNATYYGGSLQPVNLSWPVIRMAGVITLTGADNTYGANMQQAYQFSVDLVNAKGGVAVGGVPHLISVTWASDDSSLSLLKYLYNDWLNDPQYTIFLAPTQDDQFQALLPLMRQSNATFLNLFAVDPDNFAIDPYPYVFTLLQMRDVIPQYGIDQLNQRAQQYYDDVTSGVVQLSRNYGTLNPYGLGTVCMFTHTDSQLLLERRGIWEWINATNLARVQAGATEAQLIQVVQDVIWSTPSNEVDGNLYEATINDCPDETDGLLVLGETTQIDAEAVSAALASSRLRPHAAWTASNMVGYTATNATMLEQWPGWITYSTPQPLPANLPSPTFNNITEMQAAFKGYWNTTALPSSLQQLFPGCFEVIRAALNTTQSLSSDDLRVAFLALDGRTYIRGVKFNNETGVNDGSNSPIGQLDPVLGVVYAANASDLIYPYDWPWSRTDVGDALGMTQTPTPAIIGWVLVMLGCWVAQIIVEQAVFVRRRGGWYKLWLGLVSVSLGGAGVWCSQWSMSSAISLTRPSDGTTLPMSYSLDIAVLAILPAVILTWCGLYMLMRDVEPIVEENRRIQGTAAAARQLNQEQQAEKRKRAALSHEAHLYHLKDSMSRNVVAGAVFIALAIGVTRVTLWYNWSVQATVVSAAAGWIVSAILVVVLLLPALLMYFHALKLRTLAVFMLGGAVIVDWQVHVYTMTYAYAPTVLNTPSALYTLLLSSTAVSLITGIITAVTCFGFIGLQFSRMQLSRNGLSVLVASLESVINRQKAALADEQQNSAYRALQADELVRMLEAINIVRPIPKEYAWALASQANTSTFLRSFEQATAAAAASTATHTVTSTAHSPTAHSPSHTPGKSDSPLMVATRLAGPTIDGRPSPTRSSAAARPFASSPAHSITVKAKAEAIVALSQPDHVEALSDDEFKPVPLGARRSSLSSTNHSTGHLHLPSTTVTVSPTTTAGPRSTKVGWSVASPKGAADDSVVSAGGSGGGQWATTRSNRSSVNSIKSSHLATDAPMSPSHGGSVMLVQLGGAEKDKDAEPSKHSNSLNLSSGVSGNCSVDHSGRCRQYELDLLTMLHQQAQQATIAALEHPHVAAEHGRRSSTHSTDDKEFTVPATAKPPTLLELLAHPVCVELVKDELERIHSVENLVFYLHAVRYRQLQSAKAKRAVAQQLYDTFIVEAAPQQINISTRQRDTIQATLKRRGDDACTTTLFREAEREVALLMETNMMKSFISSSAYRVCGTVLRGLDMGKASGRWAEQQKAKAADEGGEITVTDVASSQGSRRTLPQTRVVFDAQTIQA